MELLEMIQALSEASGPSGFESGVRETAFRLLWPYMDEVKTDILGNLIGLRRSKKPDAPTVMLDAHLDEIGLIVTGYEKGFLRFQTLGGVDARMLPALEVKVLAPQPLFGVIDMLPPHVLTREEQEKPLAADKLFIDVGLDEESVKERVPLGTAVTFCTACAPLGEHRLCGKALDDRSCCAIVLQALELLKDRELDCHVAVLFAAQEEVGSRGALTGAYSVAPQAALAIDVTHAETPDAPPGRAYALGKGPTIGVGPNMTRRVSDELAAIARQEQIPVQIEVLRGHSGTDAWAIQTSREGVATGLVSLPLRYMHTPVEVIDLRDAQDTARLIAAWLENYGREESRDA